MIKEAFTMKFCIRKVGAILVGTALMLTLSPTSALASETDYPAGDYIVDSSVRDSDKKVVISGDGTKGWLPEIYDCFAPVSKWETCEPLTGYLVTGGGKMNYTWWVHFASFTSASVKAMGYDKGQDRWYGAGIGKDGSVDVPWNSGKVDIMAHKKLRVRSNGGIAGVRVQWQ